MYLSLNEKFEVVTVLNDTLRPSGKPARYVVEVNAGLAVRYGITPGSKVTWSDFVTGRPGGDFPVYFEHN
jgi:uncharacterized membrane protein (UPF0127 family)